MRDDVVAVILAAGRGSRLGNRTHELPKAILPIGPRSRRDATETSFLRRHVDLLREAGVQRIVVVVGYLREAILAELGAWGKDIEVVVNPTPAIETSGSLHSFQFAARGHVGVLDGGHDTILMDADIVYDRRVIGAILEGENVNALLVSSHVALDSEEVLAFGTADAPRFLGKGLSPNLVGGAPCLGEALGIVRYAAEDHWITREVMDWMVGAPRADEGTPRWKGFGPARRGTEHEELTQRLMLLGKMRAIVCPRDWAFMEVDSEPEYARCREELYPALLDDEERRGWSLERAPAKRRNAGTAAKERAPRSSAAAKAERSR